MLKTTPDSFVAAFYADSFYIEDFKQCKIFVIVDSTKTRTAHGVGKGSQTCFNGRETCTNPL